MASADYKVQLVGQNGKADWTFAIVGGMSPGEVLTVQPDGTVGFDPLPGDAADVAVTPIVATVTAAGDTVIHTPAAGMRIRLHWVSAINDPDEAASPLIKIGFGPTGGPIGTEAYRTYAVAHRQTFESAADEDLIVNLSGAAWVAVTAHIEEFAP